MFTDFKIVRFNDDDSPLKRYLIMRKVLKEKLPQLSKWGFKLLADSVQYSFKSIIVEVPYICKDYRNLNSNYYSKKHKESKYKTGRIHFFDCFIESEKDFLYNSKKYQESYIGYSVITPNTNRNIGRTVLDPFKLRIYQKNNMHCLRTKFRVHILGQNFYVSGFPYTSQNTDVIVCSHASLWGTCRYLSEKYASYAEIYPFDLVKQASTNDGKRYSQGLMWSDYSNILAKLGAFPDVVQLKEKECIVQKKGKRCKNKWRIYDYEYEKLYHYIESGFPVIASFAGHAITIIGHTIDYDKTIETDQDFINSYEFLKEYIVIDDNMPPYQKLGYRENPDNYGIIFKNRNIPNREEGYHIKSIVAAVCPFPEKVFLSVDVAKDAALTLLRKEFSISEPYAPPYVYRLFLTTSTAFKRKKILYSNISIKRGFDELCYYPVRIDMPHFVWVLEVSTLTQYKTIEKHKVENQTLKAGTAFAEVIIDSTAGNSDDKWIYYRIKNRIELPGKQKIEEDDYPEVFPQFIHNLDDN